MFGDKTYDKLDEISQLVEPMTWSCNDALIKAPDIVEIDFDFISNLMRINGVGTSIDRRQVFKHMINTHPERKFLEANNFLNIVNDSTYRLEFENESNTSTIDLAKKTLDGRIYFKKIKQSYTDSEMEKLMIEEIKSKISGYWRSKASSVSSKINELGETFDMVDIRKYRKAREKTEYFRHELEKQFKEYKLNIRSVDLGFRFANWLNKYICYDNNQAMKNMCLLKVMSHSGKAIYSMESEEEL